MLAKTNFQDYTRTDTARIWHVLLIEPQHEVTVAAHLIGRCITHYLPMVRCMTTRGLKRTKVPVMRPMMRGYVFVDIATAAGREHQIRTVPGVHSYLRLGERLATVSEPEIQKLRGIEQALVKPKEIQSIWDIGEEVRISDGPFCGLNATIVDLYSGDRIKVEVAFMHRAVPLELEAAAIDKL